MWIVIRDAPNYEINEEGIVRVIANKRIRRPRLHHTGYYQIGLDIGYKKQLVRLIHRLVAIAFIPNPDNLPEVDHKDRNPINNHVNNLRWASRKFNTANRLLHNTYICHNATDDKWEVNVQWDKSLNSSFNSLHQAYIYLSNLQINSNE